MSQNEILQLILYCLLLVLCVKPLGLFMAKVFLSEKTFITPILQPVENFIYKLSGVDNKEEMDWKRYTFALLFFNFLG